MVSHGTLKSKTPLVSCHELVEGTAHGHFIALAIICVNYQVPAELCKVLGIFFFNHDFGNCTINCVGYMFIPALPSSLDVLLLTKVNTPYSYLKCLNWGLNYCILLLLFPFKASDDECILGSIVE